MFTRRQTSQLSPYRYITLSFGPADNAGAAANNKELIRFVLPFKARFVKAIAISPNVTGDACKINVFDTTGTGAAMTADSAPMTDGTAVTVEANETYGAATKWLDAGTVITLRAKTDADTGEITDLTALFIFESYHGVCGRTNDF